MPSQTSQGSGGAPASGPNSIAKYMQAHQMMLQAFGPNQGANVHSLAGVNSTSSVQSANQ